MIDRGDWLAQAVTHLRAPVDRDSEALDRRIGIAVRRDHAVRRTRRRIGLAVGVLAAVIGAALSLRPPRLGTTIEFEIELPAAGRVDLVGDFNNWDQGGTPMHRGPRPGQWLAAVPLANGAYRYGFLVDRVSWVVDPTKATAPDADFGQPTSLLMVE